MPPLLREEKTWEPNNLIFVFFWDEINIFNPKNERIYIYRHTPQGNKELLQHMQTLKKKN